jgi:predicted DsbA family dithiol-disulfide isomerase
VAESLERRYGARVTWLPFDLHPEYPPEGIPRDDLRRRYGAGTDELLRRRMEAAELPFTLSEHIPNSRAALRVTELARDAGLHEALHDLLMNAYWADGEDIGDHAVLRRHAVSAGLEADDVDDVIGSDRYLDRVTASTQEAVSIGVTGVPAFLLDGRLLVLGAQPDEVFERAFEQLGRSSGEEPDPDA